MRRLGGILCLAVVSLFAASVVQDAGAAKKKPPPIPFSRPEIVLAWINDYRLKPTPERLPDAFKAMREQGSFKEIEQAGIYVGFIAGVIGANPDKAERLITAMFPMPPPDQAVLVKAIAYSGLAEWKELLGKFVERMPARKVIIERYLYGKLQVLRDLPLDSPIAVDANWGYYFATGSSEPIQRLVRTLAWSREKNNVEKLTIGSMVKWTLAQNASKDHDLLSYLKTSLPHQPAEVEKPLTEVIEGAETFELAQIRKDALASIEELKTKGPENARNFSWWGQAGQTVFALGCVAAGVMGQVYMGVPCVVGGALSNVALKYLTPAE
ncbi:MAG: hypothetical protein WC829_22910 [Hyphomicrobium sp.]|jgi:hypothetical protein